MATTWNTLDNSDATLSGGNLIASFQASPSSFHSCRATTFKSSGKWYFEDTFQSSDGVSTGFLLIGVGNSSGSLFSYVGSDTNSGGFENNGFLAYNATPTATSWTPTALGEVIGVAIDIDAGLFWAKDVTTNSDWNVTGAGANPATGSGGFNLSGIPNLNTTGVTIMCTGYYQTSVPDTHILNTGATAFAGAVPSGFSAWDASAAASDNPPFISRARYAAATLAGFRPIAWTMVLGADMVPISAPAVTGDNPPLFSNARRMAMMLAGRKKIAWPIEVGNIMVPQPLPADEVRYNPLPLWGPLLAQ